MEATYDQIVEAVEEFKANHDKNASFCHCSSLRDGLFFDNRRQVVVEIGGFCGDGSTQPTLRVFKTDPVSIISKKWNDAGLFG